RRGVAAVGDEVWPSWRDRVRLAGAELHLLLGIAQEEPDLTLEDVERVLGMAVVVPGHPLARGDLKLGDSKTRALGVTGTPLHLVEVARVLHRFHDGPVYRSIPRRGMSAALWRCGRPRGCGILPAG